MTERSITAGAMSALGFVQRLRRRYGMRTQRRTLQLVFARLRWIPAVSQTIVHRPVLRLAVQVDARGHRREQPTPAASVVVSPATTPAPWRGRGHEPERETRPAGRPAPMQRARILRSAPSPLPPLPPPMVARQPMPIDERPTATPVERPARATSEPPVRVLRQSVPRAPSFPAEQPAARPSLDMAMRRPAVPMTAPAQLPVPPVNLRHLTDEVIRAIDQRIAAQRERFGRP